MATGVPGISTLGILVGWAAGTVDSTPWSGGTVKLLTRINGTGEINIDPETIDASALEDYVERSIAGRASTGGTYTITVNETDDTVAEWVEVFESSNGSNHGVWIEEWSPSMTKANWMFVQTPSIYPKSAKEQNSLQTVEINCTIVDYHGLDVAVKPTA